jgi:hypothetical protein
MKTILHVGFSRTGTTTLQRHLFAKHSQIRFLGKPYNCETLKSELYKLIQQESTVYDAAGLKSYLTENVWEKESDLSKKVLLISDEVLVSYSKVRDRGVVARRLKDVFGPCKILFTIRNQFDLLKTAYINRGRMLKNVPPRFDGLFVGFEEWLELSYKDCDRSYIGHADYFRTIDYYSRLFGKENLCVLPLETLTYNKENYIRVLADFMGIDFDEALHSIGEAHEHQEPDTSALGFQQFKTRYFPLSSFFIVSAALKPFYYAKKALSKKWGDGSEISSPWLERLKAFYEPGNRKLARDFDLPLEKYDYPL